MAYSLRRERLGDLLARLAEKRKVVAPVQDGPIVSYRAVQDGSRVTLDFTNSRPSPKQHLMPQTERIFRYRYDGAGLSLLEEEAPEPQVLFGVRPCDAAALLLLDGALGGEIPDAAYQARRDATTVLGLACEKAGSACCCTAFGLSPGATLGSDLMLYPDGGRLLAEALTPKGEAILQAARDLLEWAEDAALGLLRSAYQSKPVPLAERLSLDGAAADLETRFEDPAWGELAERCLGCGICTHLCPTCHCFALQDEGNSREGSRLRCWDSCMYSDFTRMAGGHNPRPSPKERLRQRFMHKLNYYPDRHEGRYLCVGCGRCVERCPVGLHLPAVLEALRKEAAPLG